MRSLSKNINMKSKKQQRGRRGAEQRSRAGRPGTWAWVGASRSPSGDVDVGRRGSGLPDWQFGDVDGGRCGQGLPGRAVLGRGCESGTPKVHSEWRLLAELTNSIMLGEPHLRNVLDAMDLVTQARETALNA